MTRLPGQLAAALCPVTLVKHSMPLQKWVRQGVASTAGIYQQPVLSVLGAVWL